MKILLFLTGTALLSVAVATQASAADRLATDFPEIIVTAQGREEDQQDVPISIQSLSGEELEQRNLRDVRSIAPFVPGFYVESQYPTTPSIVIRGISSDTADLTAEPRISVYQDGVYLSRPQTAMFELYDIERIEIIKGPQSTLFGRSALTGAVSIIQNKADPASLGAASRLGVGNLGTYIAEGMVNLPVSESMAIRLAGIARNSDGYVENLADGIGLNGNRAHALRGSLHVDIAGGGKIDLIANGQWDRFTGLSYKSGVFAPTDPVTGEVLGTRDPSTPAYLSAALAFPRGDLGGKRRMEGVTLLYEQPLADNWSLSAVGGWNRFRAEFVGDVDGFSFQTATAGEISRNRQLSGDLRLHFEPNDAVSAFVGAAFASEDGSQDILLQVDERDLLALQTGLLDRTNPIPFPESVYASGAAVAAQLQAIAGAAGFALDGTMASALASNLLDDHLENLVRTANNRYYELLGGVLVEPVSSLKVELGVRYTHERKRSGVASKIEQRSVLAGFFGAIMQPAEIRNPLLQALAVPGAPYVPQSALYPVPNFGLFYQEGSGTDEATLTGEGFSWRASALYEATPALNLYAIYARGRRPQVLSPQSARTPGGNGRFTELSAETVDSIEFGAKYASGALRFDAALYYYDYRHFQTEVLQGTTLVSVDAGRASSIGGELSAFYQAAPNLSLFASYGFTHARFGKGIYEGNHVRLSPDHSLSVGATEVVDFRFGQLSVSPTVNWRSRVFFDNSNGDLSAFQGAFLQPLPFLASQKGYALADLNLSFVSGSLPFTLGANLQNLFNKRVVRDIGNGSVSFGLPSYVAGPPRTFLITASASFGKQ